MTVPVAVAVVAMLAMFALGMFVGWKVAAWCVADIETELLRLIRRESE